MLNQADPIPTPLLQFTLRGMFLFTAICASVAASGHYFGWLGALCAALLIAIWLIGTTYRARIASSCLCLLFFVLPLLWSAHNDLEQVRHANTHSLVRCLNNLHDVETGLLLYENEHGHFPPAYVADEHGKPMHSWRILVLHYLGEDAIYRAYRFDEAWNGPHNRLLEAKCPGCFRCPSDKGPPGDTSYLAVVGPETAWPGAGFVSFADLESCGAANAIQLVEAANSGINWLEPRDLDFSQMSFRLDAAGSPCACSNHSSKVNVGVADGYVHSLPKDFSAITFRDLLIAKPGKTATFPSNP